MKKLDLLNSEGPILQAIREDGEKFCQIIDEYGENVGTLTAKDIVEFLNGEYAIVNSKGKTLDCELLPLCMQPTQEQFNEFFN